MSNKVGRPKLENTDSVKVHVDVDLVEWLDGECLNRERSRSFIVNEILRLRRSQLMRRRKGSSDGKA